MTSEELMRKLMAVPPGDILAAAMWATDEGVQLVVDADAKRTTFLVVGDTIAVVGQEPQN